MAATPAEQPEAVYREALKSAPQDYRLHESFAHFLDETDGLMEATPEQETGARLLLQYYFPYYVLGTLLKQQGRLGEERESLLKAAAWDA